MPDTTAVAASSTPVDAGAISVTSSDPTSVLANTILTQAQALFAQGSLTHLNIMAFISACMTTVEQYNGLPGDMKKQLVIMTVKLAIEKMTPDDSEYQLLLPFADYFIDTAINEMVEVNNGKLQLNVTASNPVVAFFLSLKAKIQGCFQRPAATTATPVAAAPAAVPVTPVAAASS